MRSISEGKRFPYQCVLDGDHAVEDRCHRHHTGAGIDQLLLQQPCERVGAQVIGLEERQGQEGGEVKQITEITGFSPMGISASEKASLHCGYLHYDGDIQH